MTGLARIFRAFASICLAMAVLTARGTAQDYAHTIPLGSHDVVAQVFPTDVIDPKTGQPDPRWTGNRLPDTIAHYVLMSLRRDGIVPDGFADYEVVDTGAGYEFRFSPDPAKADEAAYYQSAYPQFLGPEIAGQGLAGARACEEIGRGCWNPVGETHGSYWKFYPPLGLPFVNQRTVLLAHYPPYVSLQAGDYLNNATMARWYRLLRSVGAPEGTEPLYSNTVDANPIAAPGAGQGSYYFPVLLASAFFDAPAVGRDYISSMLRLMTQPLHVRNRADATSEEQHLTVPVLVMGSQSRQFWANKFPDTVILQKSSHIPYLPVDWTGTVSLDPAGDGPKTPYIATNHPDVGLLIGDEACPASGAHGGFSHGIWGIEQSDLNAACFAYEMGKDGADFDTVVQTCKASWLSDSLSQANAEVVCANGLIDATFDIPAEKDRCTWQEAVDWCSANANQLCASRDKWPACTQR